MVIDFEKIREDITYRRKVIARFTLLVALRDQVNLASIDTSSRAVLSKLAGNREHCTAQKRV